MTTKEILVKARKLIEKPENWTKGTNARDTEGIAIDPKSEEAVCWCSIGALVAVEDILSINTFRALSPYMKQYIASFNDAIDTTHTDILEAFDKAIHACEETS